MKGELDMAEDLHIMFRKEEKFWPFLLKLYEAAYYHYIDDRALADRYLSELENRVEHEKELYPYRFMIYRYLLYLNMVLHKYLKFHNALV